MGESQTHCRLVKILSSWIVDNLLDGEHGWMLIDAPESLPSNKPPRMGGFVPDIYVPSPPAEVLIVGEAKTARDLERRHSIAQFEAFLRLCSKSGNSCFVLAVPWYSVRLARGIMKNIMERIDTSELNIVVLEELPG